MNYELGWKIMTEFSALRPKTQNYLTDGNEENKKPKGTKSGAIKLKLTFEDNKHCLEAT